MLKMRLFYAIFPPDEISKSFRDIQLRLEKFDKYLKFVESSQIHMTIRYLGGFVSEDSFRKLQPVLREEISKFEAFNIRIKEARYGFPKRRWPRILYVSTAKSESLNKLISRTNFILEKLGLEDIQQVRHRGGSYHFTLARTKSRLTKQVISKIRAELARLDLWEGFRVDTISLIESELRKEGPKYKVVDKIKLKSF